jgi:four helix bundle protein
VHKYQSLEAWKRAHQAALLAHQATDAAFHTRARDLFNQIRRAAASVEANVVEGYLPPEPARELETLLGGAMRAIRGLLRSLRSP